MLISICACINSQTVWAVEEAEAGLGTTNRRAERLLMQHSSFSDKNIVTASLRLHLCVYQMRSAEGGFIKSASYISFKPAYVACGHLVELPQGIPNLSGQ